MTQTRPSNCFDLWVDSCHRSTGLLVEQKRADKLKVHWKSHTHTQEIFTGMHRPQCVPMCSSAKMLKRQHKQLHKRCIYTHVHFSCAATAQCNPHKYLLVKPRHSSPECEHQCEHTTLSCGMPHHHPFKDTRLSLSPVKLDFEGRLALLRAASAGISPASIHAFEHQCMMMTRPFNTRANKQVWILYMIPDE